MTRRFWDDLPPSSSTTSTRRRAATRCAAATATTTWRATATPRWRCSPPGSCLVSALARLIDRLGVSANSDDVRGDAGTNTVEANNRASLPAGLVRSASDDPNQRIRIKL